jgi:hypothetical protein
VHSNFISTKKTWSTLHLLSQKTLEGEGAAVEETYAEYMTKMTQQAYVGVSIGPYYNKMVAT